MALEVKVPEREFVILKKDKKENVVLPDPHPAMTIPEVINHYKGTYPEISTSTVDGPKMEENKAVFSFKTVIGDHG